MYQINNEKFGAFLVELRKEKNFTQKELVDQLFVSDKTVSKWERGLSIPNVSLLIPLADILNITVTELLKGEKITDKELNSQAAVCSLHSTDKNLVKQQLKETRKKWRILYVLCLFITVIEISIIHSFGITFSEMWSNLLCISVLMLLLGGWFCFFAKECLPTYYDNHKIDCYSQGLVRIRMSGLSLNNGNWGYLCITFKLWTLTTAILYPFICLITIMTLDISAWNTIKNMLIACILGGMTVTAYYVGKKYE